MFMRRVCFLLHTFTKNYFIKTISMEKKRENYVAPIAETIEIVIEQAVLSASTEVPDFGYGGDLSN